MSELNRIDAIRIIENITDKDDPAWEWAVEEFYDEDADTMPTIYDVLSLLGVTEDEYKQATGAQNTNWPEVADGYAITGLREAAAELVDNVLGPTKDGRLYTVQADFFDALKAALKEQDK